MNNEVFTRFEQVDLPVRYEIENDIWEKMDVIKYHMFTDIMISIHSKVIFKFE